jgi:hypothetical protein
MLILCSFFSLQIGIRGSCATGVKNFKKMVLLTRTDDAQIGRGQMFDIDSPFDVDATLYVPCSKEGDAYLLKKWGIYNQVFSRPSLCNTKPIIHHTDDFGRT